MSSRAIVKIAAAIALCAVSTASMAQNCMQYPEGPARFKCANQKHPALQDKLERCKEQARQMGLTPGKGDPNDVRGFVRGCMHRPG
jgi:hypothetical protein